MVRVIIKRPDGEVIDEQIDGTFTSVCKDYPNGGIVIRFKNRTYITHLSNVCLIETPDN